ncbi:MAG: YihY family inner membrane protein, partial [Deltaproteobacteria bacterium]|nr:YihY family inner membrane protein [Deltaproteobacteria bacterium]
MKSLYQPIADFFEKDIWQVHRQDPFWKDFVLNICRLVYLVLYGVTKKRLAVRATALAYTTLLSIVPLIAVSMALFKVFGGFSIVQEKLEPFIFQNLAIGTGEVVKNYILGFMKNLHTGALGITGFVFLILTVIGLLSTIEAAFDDIWGVRKTRNWLRRFNAYWTMITVGPILLVASLGFGAYVHSIPFASFFIYLLPYILTWIAFFLLYIYMPNTKVHFRSAILGALIAGSLWELAKYGYTWYAKASVSYNAIYGSLGALPLFLIWLYLGWVIVLIGAEISFAMQNIETYRQEKWIANLSYEFKEFLALILMTYICEQYEHQKGPVSAQEITHTFTLPVRAVNDVLYQLAEAHLIIESGEEDRTYIPCQPLEKISVQDVMNALRLRGDRLEVLPKNK